MTRSEEKRKVARLNELSEQFAASDKYVFVTPMWNFSFPPLMRACIDSICVAGKTFKYTEKGPVGLLTEKAAVHIQASGGIYSTGPAVDMEFGHRYLATVMRFLGVPSVEGIFVEGHAAAPDRAQEIKTEAMVRARQVARRFAGPVRTPVHAQG